MPKGRVENAAIGFRTKTGRAIGIALAGPPNAPRFVARREIQLYDPLVPASGQPYHEVMELPWPDAQVEVKPLAAIVERCATASLKAWIDEQRASGVRITHVGIVGAPERKLERIGNYHIRAHAAEGVLFRHALEVAAAKNRLPFRTIPEKTLADVIAAELAGVDMTALGRAAGRPWRADERAAAAAALLSVGAGS